jgi:outer membrane protein insertion porin family
MANLFKIVPVPGRWLIWMLAALVSGPGAVETRAGEPPQAEFKVRGYGLLGNRRLSRIIEVLHPPDQRPEFYDANFVEDAALLLFTRLRRDGHLRPIVIAHVTTEEGGRLAYEWDQPVREHPLPRQMRLRAVEFEVQPGVLYHFDSIEIVGLTAIPDNAAQAFFIEAGALLPLKRTRIYSTDRLRRGMENLAEELNRHGYEGAEITVERQEQDDESGAVDVLLVVTEGPRSVVRSITKEYFYDNEDAPQESWLVQTNTPFSRVWLQDFTQQLRATNYHSGYPDTVVEVSQIRRETVEELVLVDLLARVRSGPRVRLGGIKFEGQERTKESVMRRRVRLDPGRPLDRIRAEQGRHRLARLGVFDSVELDYEAVDEYTRNVIYRVDEGKRIDVSLLFGFGSYELLRGGAELEQRNIFGRAHHGRLRVTQSFKSSFGEYVYTMPEFVGEDVDVFFNVRGLRREEIAFTREEYGGGVGARRFVQRIRSDVTLRYEYEVLNATAGDFAFQHGLRRAGVGALIADVRHDQRDNPLSPREGYKIFTNIELASELLAGDANYQRLQVDLSYHQPLGSGRWLHLGLSHGLVPTIGSPADDLPFNRRFFPGGENSIRGYQLGEASPRDARGRIVGAESFLLNTVELEQALTATWSVVGFLDQLHSARSIEDYPIDESLYSVGGGVRWRTIIGPIRLEYGHNLNRRDGDPSGTLHFSLGFPF